MTATESRVLLSLRGDEGNENLHLKETSSFDVAAATLRDPEKALCQDAAVVVDLGPRALVACVIDGMGGMANGREAARLAAVAFEESLACSAPGARLRRDVVAAFTRAHRQVLEFCMGGGATAVAAIVGEGWLQTLHAGDAEAFVLAKDGAVRFRTVAHSPVGYARQAGILDEEQALLHAERHLVSNGLGVEGMAVHVGPRIPFGSNDTLVVATDGMTDNARESEISASLRAGPLARCTEELVTLCRERMLRALEDPFDMGEIGKPDDLSLVTVRQRRRR